MNFVIPSRKSIAWLEKYSTKDFVQISSGNALPYHEVTGYFIPTLMNWGFRNKAFGFAEYLSSIQNPNGSWNHTEDNKAYIFDTAMIIDGLSDLGSKYDLNVSRGISWIISQYQNDRFQDLYGSTLSDHLYLRVIYCLAKNGIDVSCMIKSYYTDSTARFNTLSHFYAYAFEGAARLGLNCNKYLAVINDHGGLLPEKANLNSYCFVGLSQVALSLFLVGEFSLGMKVLTFVTKFQNEESGGFFGSNGKYFPHDEIGWAVKFYLDAIYEGHKLWFKNNISIFQSTFEKGDDDERYLFVKNNIKEGDKVLEVGCGKGRYINRLNCDRYACDIADASKYVDAKFNIGSCLRLPYEDDTFDVVFAAEVLEHSIFHDNAVEECLRVLRPNGKLLIIDKDSKVDFKDLHFGEEWLNFSHFAVKYGAMVKEITDRTLAYPFYACKIVKK